MLHIKAVHPYARQRKKKYFEDVHPCHSRITFKYAANFQFPGVIQPSNFPWHVSLPVLYHIVFAIGIAYHKIMAKTIIHTFWNLSYT